MGTSAIFPRASMRAGMYESFYLRAVAPEDAVGVWVRHTVHKRPGQPPQGSVWCTLFDAERGRPYMHKLTTSTLGTPSPTWIAVGDAAAEGFPPDPGSGGASMGPGLARGRCGAASWALEWRSGEPELRHLPRELLYRTRLPRTKLTSPAPMATFDGTIEIDGRAAIEVREWPGMVGHNWGAEHAERWIWLHGVGFEQAPEAWLDVALGRVRIGAWTTPWVANGALSVGGTRHRIGGIGTRGTRVEETAGGCSLELAGGEGLSLQVSVEVPSGTAAGWRYADPDRGGHDVVNCSIAALELNVKLPGEGAARSLRSSHGGVYELGMRERDHGVPIAPFEDG